MPTGSTALTKSIWFTRNNCISSARAFSRPRDEQHTTMSESINIMAVLLSAVHTHTYTAALPYSPRGRMIADPNWSSVLPLLVDIREEAQTVARDRELVGTWHTTDIASLRPPSMHYCGCHRNPKPRRGCSRCLHMNHTAKDCIPLPLVWIGNLNIISVTKCTLNNQTLVYTAMVRLLEPLT